MLFAFIMGAITATALIILVSYAATIGEKGTMKNEKNSNRPRD